MMNVLGTIVAYVLLFALAIAVITLIVCAMILHDQDKANQPAPIPAPTFDGPSRWEVEKTVNRLLREDRKRPTRRMEWRVPNV